MDRLERWFSIAINVGVVIGLVLVSYQISQTNDALALENRRWDTEYRFQRTEMFTEFFRHIAADQEMTSLWKRGSAGDDLSEEELYRYEMLASQLFSIQWNNYQNNLAWNPEGDDRGLIYTVRMLRTLPGAKAALEKWLKTGSFADYSRELDRVEKFLED